MHDGFSHVVLWASCLPQHTRMPYAELPSAPLLTSPCFPPLHLAAHIPYRDSTLTKLLQPSLSGGSRVLLIATVKPSQDGPTRATLDFAADCAKLQPQPVRRLLPPPVPVEPVVAVAEAAYLAAVAEAAAVAAASAADTTGAAGTPTRPLRQPKRPHTPGSLWRPPLSECRPNWARYHGIVMESGGRCAAQLIL